MIKILIMIHRSKLSFLKEKEIYKSVASELKNIKILEKNGLFSIITKDKIIDFDYEYLNLKTKNFKKYNLVISTGLFAIFNENISTGDLALPTSSIDLNISKDNKKIVIKKEKSSLKTKTEGFLKKLIKYEIKLKQDRLTEAKNISKIIIHKNSKFLKCNTLFLPSKIKEAKIYLKENKKFRQIKDLKKILLKYDGLNCDTGQMFKLRKKGMILFSVGADKPYQKIELSNSFRENFRNGKLDDKDALKKLELINDLKRIMLIYLIKEDLNEFLN